MNAAGVGARLGGAAPRSLVLAVLCFALGAAEDPAHAAQSGTRFEDCAGCPAMVVVPAGRFVMGAAPDEEAREQLGAGFRGRSEPRREVVVPAFALGVHEVSVAQYRAFAAATGRGDGDGCFVWSAAGFVTDARRSWRDPGFDQGEDHPAVCVSWDDARAYVAWLGARTGQRYRLPSEAEWEYAARAGSTAIRFWGDDPGAACLYANGADRATREQAAAAIDGETHDCADGHARTAPVGRFRANAFGIHDVLGNAAEWTEDCWQPDYRAARADAGASAAGDCSMRVVRGGAWDEGPAGLRLAYRVGSPTTIRVYGRGFRVARDL